MNNTASIFAFLALLAGCTPEGTPRSEGAKQAAAVNAQLDDVKEETREALQAVGDLAFARKADFVARMKLELETFRVELDQLSAEAKDKARVEAVREKWANAKRALDAAEAANDSNWEVVKAGFKASYTDMKDSVRTTRQWLSEQIKPE